MTGSSTKDSIIVMKFGGTSVQTEESRQHVIKHIRRNVELGKKVVAVVSAMGRKGDPYATDTLISLLKDVGEPVNPAELDSVMSIGERLSSAYFSHLLTVNKMPAAAFTGGQAGILTDNNPGNAEILEINTSRIRKALSERKITVVAGFQGVTSEGDVRTLGRGGSDTSAVALGSSLGAEVVEIYSDVDGIANCDPRQIPEAVFMDSVSVTQILSMADEGSTVIHPRAVKASLKTKTDIVVRNTFNEKSGTIIFHNAPDQQSDQVALAHRDELALIEFDKKTDALKTVPELIQLDDQKFLLKNDVYFKSRIKELQKNFGTVKKDQDWATISVVFDKPVPKIKDIQDAKIMQSSKNAICYLLKEVNLSASMRTLYNHYIRL
ncbi:MAG: aspartate kinase [SAR324 cluster bacterium]|jgi:aspartate kinase|nr:aspartate kinase [SAR324 cluster bacterium]